MWTNRFFSMSRSLFFMSAPVLYGTLFVLFLCKAFFSLDPDFGWHISSGAYIAEHGVPRADIYSYTAPNFPWVHHEWLADTISAWVYRHAGGFAALAVCFAALWTLAFWLVARNARYRALILLAAVVVLPFSGVRAITWTAVLSAVLIAATSSKSRRIIWGIPLLMLLWANMHGSFVVGLAYLLWLALHSRSALLAAVLVVSLCASLVNPYGVEIYTEIIRTMSDSALHSRISEWWPFQVDVGLGVLVGVWAGLVFVQKQVWWRKFLRFETLLLVMAIFGARHTVLFVFFTLPVLLALASQIKIPSSLLRNHTTKRGSIVLVVLLYCPVGLVVMDTFRGYTFHREDSYPSQIAAYLRDHPCDGNTFAHYDFGGYLIWKVPGQKLYIDGRMPSWRTQTDDYMKTYLDVIKNPTVRSKEFARYTIRCVVWGQDADFTQDLLQSGWHIAQSEPTSRIVLLTKSN